MEIDEKIKRIRNKAATGPERLLKKNLLMPGLHIILAKLFNILWYSMVENWRPITIGPILGRIFSSILNGRLRRGINQSLRQKGFTSENGCKINIDMMNAALNYCKRNRGGCSQ